MSTLGKTIVIKGEVRALEDMKVEGRIEGPVFCDGCAVVIGLEGSVEGEVVAEDITVFGRMQGQLVAADIVDLRAEATVTGQIVSKRFVLNDGARFSGTSSRSISRPRSGWPAFNSSRNGRPRPVR